MKTAQRNEFLSALEGALGDQPDLAVVHSSMAALAPQQALQKWDVLYALDQLVRKGWTLVFPAFTFSFCGCGLYDREHTPSETGVVADWVLEGISGAARTDHPIYSFVVVGPLSEQIMVCSSETTFGDTSPFAVFEKEDARVVMLGADWSFCTPFHRYEERAEVPYRYFKTFEGVITRQGEQATTSATMYVRDLDLAAENDFEPLINALRESGRISSVPLWRAAVEVTTMGAIRTCAEMLLADDVLAFVGNAAAVRYRMDMQQEAARLQPFRIALMGASNLDIAAQDLRNVMPNLMPGRACEVYVPPFGQVMPQIVQPQSELEQFDAELTIFVDRLEDLLGVPSLEQVSSDVIFDAVQQHVALIRRFAESNGADVIVHRFALTGRYGVERTMQLSAMVGECNRMLDEGLQDRAQVIWIDMAAEVSFGQSVWDPRLWHIGRIPFSKEFSKTLVNRWSGIVLALLGKTARLLVLDLDHTLWGGVLGEDGPEGIAIGGDFPGNSFSRFQQTLKGMSEKGIALAICSKNDEDLAVDVLSNHDSMIIRLDDLVSHRINWNPKWQNICEIAAELDLGLGSVMFIDDNPVERESVKLNLPMVKVLELPQDPTDYTDAFLDSPFIESIRTVKEDHKRVASYKARKKINVERSSAASIEDFLRGLKMQLHMQPLDESNIARAAQLCQKTNQFNTTTQRHSARDLEAIVAEGGDVCVIGMEDKFTGHENIGLIILKPDAQKSVGEIDVFLLSCRVLGRTLEQAVLDWATNRARAREWTHLSGLILETPRNTPVRKVYSENGFETGALEGQWVRVAAVSTLPDWFNVHDGFQTA